MKVVFVFCEGAHDVALLRRLLPRLPGVAECARKLKEYPAPFHTFWSAQLANVVARMATRPAEHRGKLRPPWLEMAFEGGDFLYLLFSMDGMTQRAAMLAVIEDWKKTYSADFGAPSAIDAWAAAFVLDADDVGVEARRAELFTWLVEKKILGAQPADGDAWALHDGHAVGCFVVHGPDVRTGSIEDHWIPIADRAVDVRMREARAFVASHRTDGAEVTKAGRANKAALTIAGQIEFPGASLAVILRDTEWATDQDLEATAIGRELLGFFRSVPV